MGLQGKGEIWTGTSEAKRDFPLPLHIDVEAWRGWEE